jgi:hypothetical protein
VVKLCILGITLYSVCVCVCVCVLPSLQFHRTWKLKGQTFAVSYDFILHGIFMYPLCTLCIYQILRCSLQLQVHACTMSTFGGPCTVVNVDFLNILTLTRFSWFFFFLLMCWMDTVTEFMGHLGGAIHSTLPLGIKLQIWILSKWLLPWS